MKKMFILALLATASAQMNAQTARIALRSHSGSDADYSMVSEDGNFGLGPEQLKMRDATRDSLYRKSINDSIALAKKTISDSLERARLYISVDSASSKPVYRKPKPKTKKKIQPKH